MSGSHRLSSRLGLAALLAGTAACAEIRDFLIPPSSMESPARRDRPSNTPTLAIDDVLLPGDSTPSSVGLRGGRVVAIAKGRSLPSDDPHLQRVAGEGQALVPALTDAHVHLEGAALLRLRSSRRHHRKQRQARAEPSHRHPLLHGASPVRLRHAGNAR